MAAIGPRPGKRQRTEEPPRLPLYEKLPDQVLNKIANEYLRTNAHASLSLASKMCNRLVTSEKPFDIYTSNHSKLVYQGLKEHKIIPLPVLSEFKPKEIN